MAYSPLTALPVTHRPNTIELSELGIRLPHLTFGGKADCSSISNSGWLPFRLNSKVTTAMG